MNALEYGTREAAAPGPREAAIHNYDYESMNASEPRVPIPGVGFFVAPFAAMYGFAKGGEIFKELEKKYNLK